MFKRIWYLMAFLVILILTNILTSYITLYCNRSDGHIYIVVFKDSNQDSEIIKTAQKDKGSRTVKIGVLLPDNSLSGDEVEDWKYAQSCLANHIEWVPSPPKCKMPDWLLLLYPGLEGTGFGFEYVPQTKMVSE